VVFIDSDIICLGNIDYLFSDDLNDCDIAMAKDDGIRLDQDYEGHPLVNSGVIVINKPVLSQDTVDDLIEIAAEGKSYDGGDQGVINEWITRYKLKLDILPMEYNMLKRINQHYPKIWQDIADKIKLLHYVGVKPWQTDPEQDKKDYVEVNTIWLRA